MKRSIYIFLLIIFMSDINTEVFAYQAKINGIYYNFYYKNNVHSAEVTYKNGDLVSGGNIVYTSDYTGNVVIPESVIYNGTTYKVTTIGNNAFRSCGGLTSIEIPNSVTSIGNDAFSGTAWYDNQPDGVVYAGKVAYKYKGEMPANTNISINDGTIGIADNAFSCCYGLNSIIIPNSVTSIGSEAFFACSGLTSLVLSNNLDSMGYMAFWGCSGLTSLTIPDGVKIVGDHAFQACTGLTSITIPNSVTIIGKSAFHSCKSLISLTIPSGVSTIGDYAFAYNEGLTYVTVHSSPSNIGEDLFTNSTNIKEVVFDCEKVTSLFRGVTTIDKFTIKDGVKEIGVGAFGGLTNITSISLPNSLTTIGESAFSGCTGLNSIDLPNSLISIGGYAFYRCSSLKSLVIPNSVSTIGTSAFASCNNLFSVTIGSGVTSIGTFAFIYDQTYFSSYVKKAIWLTNTPPNGYKNVGASVNYVSNDQYSSLSNTKEYKFLSSKFVVDGIVYVPVSPSERTCDAIDCLYNESSENVNIGQTITNKGITLIVKKVNPYTCYGNNYIKEVNLSLGGDVGENAFWGCNALNNATINNQGHIGERSFYSCTALSTVTISNQGDIGPSAFYGCTALKSATISNQGGIGNYSFSGCSLLETAELGQNVTSIGGYAFSYCSKLKSIVIPDAVTSLGSYAFNNCAAMTSAKTGNGIETIDEYTFSGCSSLIEMNIGSKVKTVNQYAFKGCSAFPSITIPQAVTNINNYAFSGCTSLKEFKIADSDTELTIGSNGNNPIFSSCPLETVYIGRNINYKTSSDYGYSPFYRNTSLKTVKIADKETEISENEFYGCTNLQSVTIGDGVITIGNWAFSGCQSLKYFAFGSQVQSIGQEAFSDCSAVVEISSKATTPPNCGSQALDDINKWECRLFVPEGCMATYQDADQWKDFFFTDEGEGTSGQNPDDPSIDNPDGKKCEAPTISVVGGKIKFDCNTNGVLYHYNITCLDVKDGVINTSEVEIHKTYRISVYASKDGYDDSATTTKDIKMTSDGDLNDDGKINVADVVELTNIIMNQEP